MRGSRSQSFIQALIHRPRSLWLRRAVFQVHLWAGVALALYVVVVGITGSILVFREELGTVAKIHEGEPLHSAIAMADAAAVAAQSAPGMRITFAVPPTTDRPQYIFGILHQSPVHVDAASGKRVPPSTERTWIEFLAALHYELSLGGFGWHANGAGAVVLLLLAVTGLLLWWPGVASFARSLLVDFRRGWQRVIWDVHTVSGVCALGMLVMWSLTAILFIWPETIQSPLRWVAPISQPSIPMCPSAKCLSKQC